MVPGNNPGCLGVWDRSATIVAEATLHVQNEHRMRPAGFPTVTDECGGPRDLDLPYNTQPYYEWHGMSLEGGTLQSVADSSVPAYEEPIHHVCLCDAADDCGAPTSWHDLGQLEVEPYTTFFSNNFEGVTDGGVSAAIGVGGDLFETYRMDELETYYPELTKQRRGVYATVKVFREFCAQRCMANPACQGFDYWDDGGWSVAGTEHSHKTCYLRGEGFVVQALCTDYCGDTAPSFNFKTAPRREQWNWFPSFNHTDAGLGSKKNPTYAKTGDCPLRMFGGLNASVIPRRVAFEKLPSDTTLGRLRALMQPDIAENRAGRGNENQYHRNSHAGDGTVFPGVYEEKSVQTFSAMPPAGAAVPASGGSVQGRRLDSRALAEAPLPHAAATAAAAVTDAAAAAVAAAAALPDRRARQLMQLEQEVEPELSTRRELEMAAAGAAGERSFSGGLYWPDAKATCGGIALGAPCADSSPSLSTGSTPSSALMHFGCGVWSDADPRPWCYTEKGERGIPPSEWGYCDCEARERCCVKYPRGVPTARLKSGAPQRQTPQKLQKGAPCGPPFCNSGAPNG